MHIKFTGLYTVSVNCILIFLNTKALQSSLLFREILTDDLLVH